MGRLLQLGSVILRIYANDHLPPHFHVIAPDFEALVEIETLSILRGTLPAKVRRTVLGWASDNKAAVIREWNRLNPRFPIAWR